MRSEGQRPACVKVGEQQRVVCRRRVEPSAAEARRRSEFSQLRLGVCALLPLHLQRDSPLIRRALREMELGAECVGVGR